MTSDETLRADAAEGLASFGCSGRARHLGASALGCVWATASGGEQHWAAGHSCLFRLRASARCCVPRRAAMRRLRTIAAWSGRVSLKGSSPWQASAGVPVGEDGSAE